MAQLSRKTQPHAVMRVAPRSFGPPRPAARFSPANAQAERYTYLPNVSNRNQLVLKEMFRVEDKLATRWQQSQLLQSLQASPARESSRESSRSDWTSRIRYNLGLLESNTPATPVHDPSLPFAKTHIRNQSYDPIRGHVREYARPPMLLRSLGTQGLESYYPVEMLY